MYKRQDWTRGQTYPGWRLLGDQRLDGIMPYYPLVLLLFGYLMVSSWRMPKFGKLKVRSLNLMTMGMLAIGYCLAMLQLAPEFLIFGGLLYLPAVSYTHLDVYKRQVTPSWGKK